MSGLEDRLSLDITEALQAVERIESAFVEAGRGLQNALDQAVQSFVVPDTTVDLTANVDEVAPAVEDALAQADTVVPVEGDTSELTSAIDEAVQEADAIVPVEADVSDAQAALDSLEAPVLTPEVDTSGIEEASSAMSDLNTNSRAAAEGANSAGLEIASVGALSRVAVGDTSALSGALAGAGPAGAAGAAGLAAFTAAGAVLFTQGLQSRAAQERFNLILGDFAGVVDRVDIGGLNEDLTSLAVRLGDDDEALKNAAATMFNLGKNSGAAAPEVAKTTKEIIALAARSVALNPALGDVGDVAQRLFTGLARGGRFAANFGISLSTAEINARAMSNTGKTLASDLTLFDKSAAGAQITVEKLGNSLATDINAGADNIEFRFRALRGQFSETLDVLGEPLVDPILKAAEDVQPALIALAEGFGAIAQGAVPVVAALADGLAPALQIVTPLAQGVGDALGVVADILDVIPAGAKGAAVGITALAVAVRTLNTASTLGPAGGGGALARLVQQFPLLARVAPPAIAALVTTAAVTSVFTARMKEGDKAVNDLISTLKTGEGGVQSLQTIEELQARVDALRQTSNEFLQDSKEAGGGILGVFRQKGEVRDLFNAASSVNDLANETQTMVNVARQLREEFGISSQRAVELAHGGDQIVAAFRQAASGFDEVTAAETAAFLELDRIFLAARAGKATVEDLDRASVLLGEDIDAVGTQFREARQPVLDFGQAIIDSLPGVNEALAKMNEDGKASLNEFLDEFTKSTLEAAAFVGNIRELIRRGATDLADELSSMGAEAAAGLAAEAVTLSEAELTAAEANIDRIRTIRSNVATEAQGVADDLKGGIEFTAQETRRVLGEKLEAIPGQLSSSTLGAGKAFIAGITAGVVTGAAEEGEKIFAETKGLGEQANAGFASGLASDTDAINLAALEMRRKVVAALENVFQIFSPSKVTQEIGELVAEGFIVGLSDVEGAAAALDPVLDVLDKFKLTAQDVASASGDSIDDLVQSLTDLGEAQKEITPDELKAIGEATKALGGTAGVKKLQAAQAQQVAASFGGLSAAEIAEAVSKMRTGAAVQRGQAIFGVTPVVPDPFETNVIKGADRGAPNVDLTVNVTPPPEATAEEMALLTARATGWVLQGAPLQ